MNNAINDLFEIDFSILLSIKSVHANRILNGTKHFELRKSAPKNTPRLVFLYDTDLAAITGWFLLKSIDIGTPKQIWEKVGVRATPKDSFNKYYANSTRAVALGIEKAYSLKTPISLPEAKKVEPGFTVPQAFAYLKNYPSLLEALYRRAQDGVTAQVSTPKFAISKILPSQHKEFIQQVNRHITGSYNETGKSYAKFLLDSHESGYDPEGVFTKGKTIFSIYWGGELAGYLVTTMKIGGSVKTGPVIIFENYRQQGLGQSLRVLVHDIYKAIGFRKVYATVPANNIAACQYLIAANYQIEGHLNRHYHDRHDELVLGYLLSESRGVPQPIQRQITPLYKFYRMSKSSSEIALHLKSVFSEVYCEVTNGWVTRQISQALSAGRGNSKELLKPRIIFAADGPTGVSATALCVLKRGGSAKISMLTETSHINGLVAFLSHISKSLSRLRTAKVRKLYSHVPVHDTDLMSAYYLAGYSAEGIISTPYNALTDMVIFSKTLEASTTAKFQTH